MNEPRPAATVVVARVLPHDDGFEVYLVKRHGRAGFMAGAHVFPGGRVDDDDAHWDLDPFAVAAVRETFEECGVLLARHESGLPMTSSSLVDAVSARVAGGENFRSALLSVGLSPDVEALTPIAWWITPEAEPKRFDTRFFFAQIPAWQRDRADVDGDEVTEGLWSTPRAALEAYARRDIALAPPTLATLEDLADVPSLGAVRKASWVLRPILPVIIEAQGGMVLALPGDPLHDEPEAVSERRTRFVVDEDGRFRSRRER